MNKDKKQFTLSELNKIDGAFDRGNKYKCVKSSNDVYLVGTTYHCNGRGIVDEYDDGDNNSSCSIGDECFLFEKVEETKHYWNGKEELEVGHVFMHKCDEAKVLSLSNEHGGVVTFTVDDGASIECCWNNDAWVKPIDKRTDKEKFIDEIINDLPAYVRADELDIRMAIEKAYDKLKGDEK